MLALARRRLDAPWSPEVSIVDASLWGRGVLTGERAPGLVASCGRWRERWRFSRAGEPAKLAPRAAAG
eukprot:7858651-Lingulodinium_polyedra.AAC.1